MKRKTKVIIGLVLLAIGAGGYFYAVSETSSNGYQLAKSFGAANTSIEVIGGISFFVGIIGVIFLVIALFGAIMNGVLFGTKQDD